MIEKFIQELTDKNMFLVKKGDKLILKGNKGQLTPEEITYIKENTYIANFITENKTEILQYLDSNMPQKKIYNLSPLQQGILFHELYDVDSKTYNFLTTIDFPEGINEEVLKSALTCVIKKHSILRTSFITDRFDIPVQEVHKNVSLPFESFDFRKYPEERVNVFIKEQYSKAFDLTRAPLMHFVLLRISDDAYKMIWVFHHLILDGWSIPIFFNEILDNYKKISNKESIEEQETDNYEDYIKYLSFKNSNSETQFWKRYLNGIESSTLLPFIDNNSERNKGGKDTEKISLHFDNYNTEKIKECSKNLRVTPNTLFQAVWAFILSKYTGIEDPVFGVVISGRSTSIADVENRIGIYTNTLPLRSKLNIHTELKDWLAELQKDNALIRENEGLTISQIQQEIGIKNDFFDSIMVFQNYPKNFTDDKDELSLKTANIMTKQYSNFPLTISINMTDETQVFFYYNGSLLKERHVEMFKNHFQHIINQIVANPGIQLKDLEILTVNEKQKFLSALESSTKDLQNNKTVIDYFEEQAALHPNNIAVVFDGKNMNYKELNEKSNRLAHYIKDNYSIQNEDIIAVISSRSQWYIIAVLAVLKSGAAYLPIDAEYPRDRKRSMINGANAKALIIESELLQEVIDFSVSTFSIDIMFNTLKNSIENIDRNETSINSLAYVIYTSGSSGTPKGVMIEHKSLLNLCMWHKNQYEVFQTSRSTVYSGISFDASVWEIFPYLINGASLYLMNDNDIRYNIDELQNYLLKHEITHAYLPTQICVEFIKNKVSLTSTKILTGGEALIIPHPTNLNIYNNYGPTENTVVTTFCKVSNDFMGIMPIGKPIANTSVYIVDAENKLVPEGDYGELCIGGTSLARGYLNQSYLTAEKFVENPNIQGVVSKMYKSGDMARWMSDGNLEFKGRIDDQIKIRGFRVELGEIEIVLNKYEDVKQSYITVIDDRNGNKQLIAFIIPNDNFVIKDIKDYLKGQLPSYMIPTKIIEVDAIPLNFNGKIDKNYLLDVAKNNISCDNNYVGPRNEIEKELISIWKEILVLDEIGIYDDFFELGGHSLLAIKVIKKIKSAFDLIISVQDVFNHSTISDLNYLIRNKDLTDQLLNGNIDLEKESKMEVDFSNIQKVEKYQQITENILLTGATGFIGAYILHGLLEKTKAVIYCVIRDTNEIEGKTRIENTLKYYHLFKESYSNRIISVIGDLAMPNIGIEDNTYLSLSAKIDYVFHVATFMDHFSSYEKLKNVNVAGNIEIVKFSILNKVKKIIYTSTLGNYTGNETIYEHHSRESETHSYANGYSASKWVGERIMSKAIENGLDIQVFRIGLVTGDFASGRMPKEQWFPKLLKSCYEVGIYTPGFLIPLIPVDFVADALIK